MLRINLFPLIGLISLAVAMWGAGEHRAAIRSEEVLMVEDFESVRENALPEGWVYLARRGGDRVPPEHVMNAREKFYVVQENGNNVLRAYTEGESQRISLVNREDGFNWDLRTHPHLAWDWRALQLPEGANEEEINDTGAAFYVTFGKDWLGRPRSIKYTYSSSLPVGTVVSFGVLKVIVVASGADGLGDWVRIERDVVADYRRVFRRDPPDHPRFITLWSDSDDTKSIAEVDFDNIRLLPLDE
ncbi:MAG: DUF3047 domain-containing protein [Rhodothermales bacterium]